MSERSRGRPVAAPGSGEPETSPGPPFLANVCVLLVARLAGAEAVTSKLSGGGVPLRLYWRSPLLQPAEALLMDSSHGRRPSASASQGLVAFVDLNVTLIPSGCAEGSGCGRRRRLPRVEARFGALVRWSPSGIDEGAYAPEGASTPADRRRGLTMGSEYVRQARRLSRKGLIKYGETVGVDVAEMESGPTAALLATSLQLPNLAAAVNVAKEKEEQAPTTVLVQLRHPELGGEHGAFSIVGDHGDIDAERGDIGELATNMLLANLMDEESKKKGILSTTTSTNTRNDGCDDDQENRVREAFKRWWFDASTFVPVVDAANEPRGVNQALTEEKEVEHQREAIAHPFVAPPLTGTGKDGVRDRRGAKVFHMTVPAAAAEGKIASTVSRSLAPTKKRLVGWTERAERRTKKGKGKITIGKG